MADKPETLLITENKTVVLEMHRDGKFSSALNAPPWFPLDRATANFYR